MSGDSDNDTVSGGNDNDSNDGDDNDTIDGGSQTKTYTQAEIDRIVRERLQRERAKQPSADELKSLREKAAEHDRLKAESLSAEERAKADKDAAEARAAQAEERAKKKALKAAIADACAKAQVQDVEAVAALIATGGGVEYDEDGEPKEIDKRVKEILKDRPYLKGSKFDGGADGGSRGGSPDYNDPNFLATLSMPDYMQAKAEGKIK